jgi:hypothetical protein
MKRTEYPLSWPRNWPRTPAAQRTDNGNLKATLPASIERVLHELKLFGKQSGKTVSNVMISSNVTLTSQSPQDPGVSVFFTWDGIDTCLAVDRYRKLAQNLQALALVIEAERTKLRHGGLNLVRASFTGYTALPGPSAAKREWWDVLEVRQDSSADAIKTNYRRLRSDKHPDKNDGRDGGYHEVQQAYETAQRLGRV